MNDQALRPAAKVLAEKNRPRSILTLEEDIRHFKRLLALKPDMLDLHWIILDCRRKLGHISQDEFDRQYEAVKERLRGQATPAGLP